MRDPEQLSRIADRESELFGERHHRTRNNGPRTLLLTLRARPCLPLPSQEAPDARGEPDVVREARPACVSHEQTERLPDALTCLVDRAAVGVAALHRRNARDPVSRLIQLIDHAIVLHARHPFPKHGSRSRSIARSVPGGRSSPACTGTVVTHLPHSTRTWEPLRRTSSQPSLRSRRRSSLPVTA